MGRKLLTLLDSLKPNINERIQKQRSEKIAKGEFMLVRDYRYSHKWKQGVIISTCNSRCDTENTMNSN